MIVSMKKATVIVQEKDASLTVEALRGLGVMHVEHARLPQGKSLQALKEDEALLNSCLEVWQRFEAGKVPAPAAQRTGNWQDEARRIIEMAKQYDQIEGAVRVMRASLADCKKWGDFNPQALQGLIAGGLTVKLLLVPQKQINEFPEGVYVKTVFVSAGIAGCLAVARAPFECVGKEVALPALGVSQMQGRLAEDARAMQALRDQIIASAAMSAPLLAAKADQVKQIEFQEALLGMAREGALTYITGFIPADATGRLVSCAQEEHWGVSITDPGDEDSVPVLLRNPRWIAMISPVYKLLEVLPGYRELDISLPFLIFFSIFFGILIGDAGYGLVYFLLTFTAHRMMKKKGKNTSALFLFYALSFCAIIWGLLTGTFFGQAWVLAAGYKPLAPALNDPKGMQTFCFFLGALHLSIAHGWRAVLKAPSLSALADVGWVLILWASFFMARLLILGYALPFFGNWLIIAGVTLVVFFTNPQKNIIKTLGEGLGTLALSLMNSFTDVVSYLRLFAVGLAGVAIADAFNGMAGMVGHGSIVAIAGSALIALVGHVLGVALGPVSVLVHGVRLNVLEFSGHANVSWSGVKYVPLKA